MDNSALAALPDLLASLPTSGDYCASGREPLTLPHLEVEGVGVLSFPLMAQQAKAVIARAELAPYGRGDRTLVDPTVRRVWQLSPAHFRLRDPFWPALLTRIVADAARGLGVEAPVTAELYKLLLYEPGSFFVSHRDTEKVDGMFATLVIVMPSTWEGGELVVRHAGREATPRLSSELVSWAHWAAFYADCEHEVRPVTAGHRLCLVYNLALAPGAPPPPTPDPRSAIAEAASLLRTWADEGEPGARFVLPLQHRYTPASLGWAALKGRDAGAAGVLAAAGKEAGVAVYLGMISIEESGSAEPMWSGRRGRPAATEFEIIEVFDRTARLTELAPADPDDPTPPPLEFEEDEVIPLDALEELEPDSVSFEEATGNEGGSFERTYRVAALVAWPQREADLVWMTAGWGAAVSRTRQRVEAARASGRAEDRRRAVRLGESLLTVCLPTVGQPPAVGPVLDVLRELGEVALLAEGIRRLVPGRHLQAADTEALHRALAVAGTPEIIARLVDALDPWHRDTAAFLLPLAQSAPTRAAARAGVEAWVKRLPGFPAAAPALPSPSPTTATLLLRLLAALGDDALEMATVTRVLDQLDVWALDRVLIPAVLAVDTEPGMRGRPGYELVRVVCIGHLNARVAADLSPPTDLRREAKLACSCAICTEVSGFLRSPTQATWDLRAAERDRRHVEQHLLHAGADVAFHTVRQGSPHTLRVTKTQASYERRVVQRREDLATLARLGEE